MTERENKRPELIIAPAVNGPWGVVSATSGPGEDRGIPADVRRKADAAIRAGMVALERVRPRQLDRAEACFRQALDVLTAVLPEPHPRVSYALDRLGLTYQLQGRLEAAEPLYLRSLEVLGPNDRPTKWNDVTLLNLAILYGCQGREWEREQVLRRFRGEEQPEP